MKHVFSMLFVLFLLTACATQQPAQQAQPEVAQLQSEPGRNFTCYADADCELRNNNVNCIRAFHKEDPNPNAPQIPPSHTECPDPEDIVAYCDNGKCSIKYDCAKCSSLKAKLGEYCPTHMEGTAGWICRMYNACNC
ncbi:MAG: hypothetical protein QXM31_02010 [Candidatus Woesearchaeota archaeon]